jgi:DNA-binding MarR family transcriptional regulator
VSSPPGEEIQATAQRLHAAAIHLLRALRRQDTATGVGPARLSALSVLVFRGPSTLGELAQAEQVRPPTMSRIVSGLEEAGLVRRRADPADARRAHLHATPAGRRLMEKARDRRVDELASWLAALPEEERAELARALDTVERVLRARAGRPRV